jgi:hypothetical protein
MYTGTMYSGTLISDLKAVVERAERYAEVRAQQLRIAEDAEMRAVFGTQSMQGTQEYQIYAGAA